MNEPNVGAWEAGLRLLVADGYKVTRIGDQIMVRTPRPRVPVILCVVIALLLPLLVMVIKDIHPGQGVRLTFTLSLLAAAILAFVGSTFSREKLILGERLTLVRGVLGILMSASWERDEIVEFVIRPLDAGTPSTLSLLGLEGKSEPLVYSAVSDVPFVLKSLLEHWRTGGIWPPDTQSLPLK